MLRIRPIPAGPRLLLPACILLLLLAAAGASAQISVVLFQPPPNQLRVSDLWRIQLTNASRKTVDVYLQGTAREERDGLVVDAQSRVFSVPPGALMVRGSQIEPIKVNESHPRYRAVATRTGTVPSGEYEVCVYVKDPATGETLASDCITQIIERLTPPILVAPMNESDVTEKLPTFTWTPPVPLPTGGTRVTYTLRIAEIYGRQTAYDALQSNPAFYERSNIPTTIVQYPISSRSFEPKKRYAWRITAFAENVNLGESEVWEFTKKESLIALEAELIADETLVASILRFNADYVVAGNGVSAALVGSDDIHVWTWGNNEYGQLGTGGTPTTARSSPKEVNGLTYMTAVAPGGEHSIALGPYGQVAAWGNNDYGQLGLGNTNSTNTPKWVGSFTGAVSVAAGAYHSVALKGDGTVWAWGYNRTGELGDGTKHDRDAPAKVNGLGEITAIAAGNGHTLALKSDGTVWAWGTNRYGQADPSLNAAPIVDKPVKIDGLSNVKAIAAGANFSLALLNDGTVRAWGDNNSGQLGNGEADPDAKLIERFIAGRVKSGSGSTGGGSGRFKAIESLKTSPVIEGGISIKKNLELGLVLPNLSGVVSVSGLTSVSAIDGGGAHAIALRSDSTVWTWGNNHWGMLGTGDREYHSGPTRVIGIEDALTVSAGSEHSIAVRRNGNVLAWGNNEHKQLGMDQVPASVGVDGENIAVSPIAVPRQ